MYTMNTLNSHQWDITQTSMRCLASWYASNNDPMLRLQSAAQRLTFGGPMTLLGGGLSSSNEKAPFFLLEKDMAPHTQVFASLVMFSLGQQLVRAHCFCWRDGKHVKWWMRAANNTAETNTLSLTQTHTRTLRQRLINGYIFTFFDTASVELAP